MAAMAGAAIFFTGSLFNASSSAPQTSRTTYGTHELAVKQAAQTSNVWGSVRTPPAVASQVPRYVYVRPDDPVVTQTAIYKPQQASQGKLGTQVTSYPQLDLTPSQNIWRSQPAAASAGSSARLFPFTTTSPQADPTQVQPLIFTPLAGLSTNTGQGTSYTFGTHALAIHQSQNVSSIWPSVRTPPVAATPVASAWFKSQPQFDPSQVQSVIWGPSQNEGGWLSLSVISAPQDDQSLTQSQVFKSAVATVAVSAQRVFTWVGATPQIDTTPVVQWIFKSAAGPAAARQWPMVQTAPQADPTQIAPQVFQSLRTPPAILGPTVTPFVLNGQLDTSLPTVAVWTPSTFSQSAPASTDFTQKPAGKKRRRYEVEIDGQVFEVASVADAVQLLEQAKSLAERRAPIVASEVVARKLADKPPINKPIRVPVPQLHTDSQELVEIVIRARHAIARIYREQAMAAEIRLRMEQKARDDDEDDVLSLLL